MSSLSHNLRTALTVLCLVAQGLVVGHHVLVTHTRCAEHGELVHVDEHADAHVDDGAVERAPESEYASVDAGDAPHADDHDHCTASTDRRKAIQAVSSTLVVDVVAVADASFVAVVGVATGRAVHVIAPKTSPPV